MPGRPPTRWIAPAAIAAVAAVGYGVVTANRGGDGGSSGTRTAKRGATTTTKRSAATGSSGPRTYVVRSGDTLSSISLETRVPLARLTELNPRLDAQALQPGQRLTLRRP